ncbi:MAG: 2-oxoglutarate dehydrogenase E1 component [Methylococcaceae bacterium TMED69]|nr:MAG: 2-oxoglutarate dehydrogenase E1 component [Methylococcaceae bacterium TMED69]
MDSAFAPNGSNLSYIESLYQSFVDDPDSVPEEWKVIFQTESSKQLNQATLRQHQSAKERAMIKPKLQTGQNENNGQIEKQVAVLQFINAFRFRGHREANLDPLGQYERPQVPELHPEFHGLTEGDLETVFNSGSLQGVGEIKLTEIINILRNTYCKNIGAEYMHIVETNEKRWIQQKLEPFAGNFPLEKKERIQLLHCVIAANSLEQHLHKKYVGQKRFSLEGGESSIALLDTLLVEAGKNQVKECVIGMAHRGRLNVLVNIVGKNPSDLFDEFEGKSVQDHRSGDVKYHLGYSSDIQTPNGPVHVTLAFNPSHLEIIDPVVEGSVRARQDRRKDSSRNKVLPVIIHGDAAFAGQGVVMETLNLSQTRGYSTGGTIHVIINNQIGFTTSDPLDSRSTLYCTDVAKMIQAPIFHVNGDDPEAVAMVGKIALEYRMEFNKDVIIDLVCYRKHGHSETDEPATTQPIMYKKIRKHPSVVDIYSGKLIEKGLLDISQFEAMKSKYLDDLKNNSVLSRPHVKIRDSSAVNYFAPFIETDWEAKHSSAISGNLISKLATAFTKIPKGFKNHRQVARILKERQMMASGEMKCDWGFAETLGYASLLTENFPVRISGQDSGRGTFSHRHAVINDQETGAPYLPLQNLSKSQSDFLVINSTLSEEAVLAYEFGYAAAEPNALIIWEAQFGDFANGAQVVIDQFIASSEAKWERYCGLVMLLPHGYDGQGPEHSSARLERFLQLCAEDNMQVCYPTTPAQMFHLLRRQVIRPYRKPLVVMSPKSLLRNTDSFSKLSEFTEGKFLNIIPEQSNISPRKVKKVILCSGKIYFELVAAREANQIDDCAIIRLEQFHPFPMKELKEILGQYKNCGELLWVQEEPRNQGAWSYLLSRRHLGGAFDESKPLRCVARPYSASPAVGYLSLHLEQQKEIINEALNLKPASKNEKKVRKTG